MFSDSYIIADFIKDELPILKDVDCRSWDFKCRSFARYAAFDILNRVQAKPLERAIDIVEDYIWSMDIMMEQKDFTGFESYERFHIFRDTAREIGLLLV